MGNAISEWSLVASEVPQGSVIGPLLFVIFINELPEKIVNKCMLYADDTKIIAKVGDTHSEQSLQRDLTTVSEWTKNWLLQLNVNKCKVMHLGKREDNKNVNPKYYLENTSKNEKKILCLTEFERDLGVYFSSDLSCYSHVQVVKARAMRILGQLKNTFESRETDLWKKN